MGLTRSTLKHSAIYSLSSILSRLISFIMLPFYANIFQTEGYGIIGMVDASLGMLGILFASGFHIAILRIYHEEEDHNKKLVISTAIRLVWVLGLAAIMLPMLFSPQLSRIFLGSERYSMLLVLSLITFLIDVSGQSASTFLIINQKSIMYSSVSIIRLVIGLTLNIWLVLILNVGLIGVFVSSLVTAIVASTIFHIAAYRAHKLNFDRSVAKKLLKFQLPLMPGEVIAFLSRQTERFLVRFLIDIHGVGILEMAYKFPPLLNLLVSMPFTQAWRTKSFEIADQPEAPLIIGKMFTNYFFLMVFTGMIMAVCIDDVLKILTPPQFWEAVGIARIEIMTTIIAASNAFLVYGLLYKKRTHIISVIKTEVALVKIAISAALIYFFKLKGAAYSALFAETVLLLLIARKSLECYPLKLEFKKLATIVGGAISIFYVLHVINQTDYYSSLILKNNFHKLISAMLAGPLFEMTTLHKIETIMLSKVGNTISLLFNLLSCMVFLLLIPFIRYDKKTDASKNTKLVDNDVL